MYLLDYSSIRLFQVIMRSDLQTLFNPFLIKFIIYYDTLQMSYSFLISFFVQCSHNKFELNDHDRHLYHTLHILDLIKSSFTAFVAPTFTPFVASSIARYSDGITYLEQFLLNISNISLPAANLSLGHRSLRVLLSSNVIYYNKNLILCWDIAAPKISRPMPYLNKSSML